ncbi:2-hydroxy-3-oxopropionate reductase [Microbacterium aoyamense]|uniref:2-hydroxy-3-oxopropionate reductase n=1 Tax=Microbacterium aoyamense TaxID=344166 RepID=A0ABP5B971_9MICO|nr:NAD(P)-dependent oxidoreductase [Microbacterium aoyamense]
MSSVVAEPVSICGLGPMGGPIAGRLLDAGSHLTVWNRTPSRTDPFVARGASFALTPSDAALPIVLTVLPDLPQVEGILAGDDGLLAGWAARGVSHPVLVVHGTTSPVDTAAFARTMEREHGVSVVDAPLSGGTIGAAAGTLSIMVGGDPMIARHAEPIFRLYGRVIRYFGPAGSGALAKACNQIVVASTVAAISEALSLAARAGLEKSTVIEILEGGLAASEVLRQKKSKWLSADYTEGGSAANQLKDLRFVEEAARELSIDLPVSTAVMSLFAEMVAAGEGELDHTGVIRVVERRAELNDE